MWDNTLPKNRFLRFCVLMAHRCGRHNVAMQSAALAFYLLFMIFPFLIFISALLGLLDLNITGMMTVLSDFLPEEVEESAKVDGATEWQLFCRIVLPLVAPGIAAVAMLSFMYAWNEYTYTVIFTRTQKGHIPGGPTDLRPERRTQGGESTTSAYQKA